MISPSLIYTRTIKELPFVTDVCITKPERKRRPRASRLARPSDPQEAVAGLAQRTIRETLYNSRKDKTINVSSRDATYCLMESVELSPAAHPKKRKSSNATEEGNKDEKRMKSHIYALKHDLDNYNQEPDFLLGGMVSISSFERISSKHL